MNPVAQTDTDVAADLGKWLLEVLLAAIPTSLIYSLIFLIVSVVIIVVCQKFRIYTRQVRIWNILTKLHYAVLVLTFMFLGFGLGLISSFQRAGNRVLDEQLHPALTQMVSPIRDQIINSVPPEMADQPITGQAIYDRIIEQASAQSEEAEGEEGVLAEMGREIGIQMRAYLAKILTEQAVSRVGEKVGLSEKGQAISLEAFKSIDFNQQADAIAGKVTGVAKTNLAGFANGFRLQLIIYALMVIGCLAIDPLLYFFIWLPRLKKEEEAQTAASGPPEIKE